MELWINILKDYMVIVIVQLVTFDLYMVKLMAKLCWYQTVVYNYSWRSAIFECLLTYNVKRWPSNFGDWRENSIAARSDEGASCNGGHSSKNFFSYSVKLKPDWKAGMIGILFLLGILLNRKILFLIIGSL